MWHYGSEAYLLPGFAVGGSRLLERDQVDQEQSGRVWLADFQKMELIWEEADDAVSSDRIHWRSRVTQCVHLAATG